MIFLAKRNLYIPECNGNRELPADEQVRFDVRAMTGEEEERYTTLLSYVEDSKKILLEPKIIETFLGQVDKVYNVYSDEAKKQPVETAKDFIKLPGTYEYITETVAFIRKGLTETELKN